MKTPVNINNKFFAVEAEAINILGIALARHRSVGKRGWSITDPRSGGAIVTGQKSKELARSEAVLRIQSHGVEKVREFLAAKPAAPAVETLPDYVIEVAKESVAKADVAGIVELVARTVDGLSERERAAVTRALNSRTGQLKAKAPSAFGDADERLAAAAWQGLQPNAFKVGLVSCFAIGHHEESRSLWQRLSAVKWPAAFDKDRLALEKAGVW